MRSVAVALAMTGILVLAGTQSVAAQAEVTSSGSGFFVNSQGWVVTNAHVLEGCKSATVSGLGDTTDWKVDKQNDLPETELSY